MRGDRHVFGEKLLPHGSYPVVIMHPLRIRITLILFFFGLGGLVSAQSTTLWWTGLQDRVGGGPGSPSSNFRMSEAIPGSYYPTPGNGNGISSNEPVDFDLVFDTALMEGANKSMFINRDNVRLGMLTLNAGPFDGFLITDQAGQSRGTTLSGGVMAPNGLHRIESVGTDFWALTDDTLWSIGSDAIVLVSMPLTGGYGLTKTGAGILALSGAQSFTGGIVVEEGMLGFQNRAALPTEGTTAVASGATLALGVGGEGFFTPADIGQLADNALPGVSLAAGARIGLETSVSDFTYGGSLEGSYGLAKIGLLTLSLTGANTYSGPTEVVQGTLYLEGSTAVASAVTVHAGAVLGGGGLIGGDLGFRAGGRLVFDPATTLQVAGTVTFAGPFGIDNLFVLDGGAPLGTYRLIEGEVDLAGVQNIGVENAARISLTRFGYFQENDGLELVLIEDGGAPAGLHAVPGSVVYWRVSPFNRFFGSNRIYTTSPSIAVLSNGDYLIAFNLFGGSLNPAATESGTTLLFRSSDKGATWSELPSSPMMDMKRGSLFLHEGDVYIWGYQSDSGPPRILKSTDNGKTWCRVDQRGREQVMDPDDQKWNEISSQEMFFLAEAGSTREVKTAYPFSYVDFVKCGQDNAAASDDYVYIYSPEMAYTHKLQLARVPKDQLGTRDAWEYFVRYEDDQPVWSEGLKDRGCVHEFPEKSRDGSYFGWYSWLPSVVWNEGLGLYIMVNGGTYGGKNLTQSDEDYYASWMHEKTGSLGFWYSKRPYGPWREFFYTDYWTVDDPRNRTYQPKLSPKWISPDGKEMVLIWSDQMRDEQKKSPNYTWNQMKITIETE